MSWFLAFVGFAALIILHELGHFAAAKAVGMRVERFALFFPPLLFTVRRGETEYGVGAIPLGGYVRITGMNPHEEIPPEHAHRAYFRQPVWKRVVVIAAGPAMNIVLAFLIFFVIFVAKGAQETTTVVDGFREGSPASQVLRSGDRIVAVDGVRGGPAELRDQIATHRCADGATTDGCRATTAAQVTVVRDGSERTLAVTPVYDAEVGRPLLGFTFGQRYERLGAADAASSSASGMWRVTKASVEAIVRLFYDSRARDDVSGVVGGYETTRQTFQADDMVLAFQILGLISLSLAVVNLFPFLPLDGGHIFWAVAEKVRGRAIPVRVMERASVVGFLLVIMLFLIGFTNDIDRLRGEGFGVR